MKMHNNCLAGLVLLTVGIGWLVAWPAFLWFMVSMEARLDTGSDAIIWRLWRALEVLLVEPAWLANTLCALIAFALGLGIVLVTVGVGTLCGHTPTLRCAPAAILSGIALCAIGLTVHWLLLIPVVWTSVHPAVARAAGDLDLAIPAALGVGLVSMIVAGVVLFGSRRQIISVTKPLKPLTTKP
jgi:hypothetical protein